MTRTWARAAGFRIHARAAGRAPPGRPTCVLVHGLVVSSRYMVPLARRLGAEYRVLAPDLPGFGRSDKPRYTLDIPGHAMVLDQWMHAAAIDRAVLIANSMGCQVVAELAVRRPERIDRCVLIGPITDPDARCGPRQVWRWLREVPREPRLYVPTVLLDFLDAGPRRTIETFRATLRHRIEELLPHVRAPCLVIRGGRDPITTDRWSRQAAALLPDGRAVVIPGHSHTVHYSGPLEVTRVIRAFLESSPRSRAPPDGTSRGTGARV